jgi:hypothetical protein
LLGRRPLVLIVVSLAALAASPAFARSDRAVRPCSAFKFSQNSPTFAGHIKVHGVSCARARVVEKADYRVAALKFLSTSFTYTTAGWRCRNRAITPNLGVPYVAVACSASRGRSISFQLGGT